MIRSQALGMWRFRWLGLAVAWVIAIGGWVTVYAMPDVYLASARVFVDTENAIEDFLGGIAAPNDVMSEVNVVVREIVSRPNLAEVARNTDLALRAGTEAEFDDLLTELQEKIYVDGNRDNIYSIAFGDADRQIALNVVDAVLTEFVEKSLGADRDDSVAAQQFLEEQIREYEQRLTLAEDELANFKRENVELMPDQRGDYFERLQSAEADLEETSRKLSLATERRAELRRQIEGEEPVFGIMTPSSGPEDGPASSKIRELELELEELRLRYTDRHPRVGQLIETIELLKRQQASRSAGSGGGAPAQTSLDSNPVYQNMRIQLTNVEVEIAALQTQRNQERATVAELRRFVDTIPQVEAELNRLNRDYDVVKAQHQLLLRQLEAANIGEDVSRSIDEVQFRVIDPPYADTSPVGPNRPLLLSAVLVVGLGAALGLTFLMNQLNPTFIGNRSVSDVLGIPVLASVSLLQTDEQRASERRGRRALQACALLLFVCFSVAVVFEQVGSTFVRQIVSGL